MNERETMNRKVFEMKQFELKEERWSDSSGSDSKYKFTEKRVGTFNLNFKLFETRFSLTSGHETKICMWTTPYDIPYL